jgi:hypothetical protein
MSKLRLPNLAVLLVDVMEPDLLRAAQLFTAFLQIVPWIRIPLPPPS